MHPLDLVSRQIVGNDDVTQVPGWDESLLDIGEETVPVHQAIDDAAGLHP